MPDANTPAAALAPTPNATSAEILTPGSPIFGETRDAASAAIAAGMQRPSDPVLTAFNALASALAAVALDAQDAGRDDACTRATVFRGQVCALRDRWAAGDPPVRRAAAKPVPAAAEPKRRGRPPRITPAGAAP